MTGMILFFIRSQLYHSGNIAVNEEHKVNRMPQFAYMATWAMLHGKHHP